MTFAEVAKVLKSSPRYVRWLAQSGKIRHFTTPTGVCKSWIMREHLEAYVREKITKKPELAVKWAATGGVK